jgi:hypothetical protein
MRHPGEMSGNLLVTCKVAIVSLALFTSTAHSQPRSLSPAPVELQMRAVNLHLEGSTVLEVRRLRGEMMPTQKEQPVCFDDLNSFVTRIASAEIAISVKTLSDLLNQRVFNYPGAPLKNLTIKVERGRIKQTGTMHKGVDLPFELEGTLDATPTGEIRLHATKIASAHVPMKGLLHLFGEDLSKLVNLKQDRGVTLEGDDIILHPDRMLPPPRIQGKVTAVRLEGDRVVLTFGSDKAKALTPPYKAASYIYHRNGVLRFGKLTMTDSDLEIVSESKQNPFDFNLPEYNRQLVAGYSKNTGAYGLIVFMRDFRLLPLPKPTPIPGK